MVLKIKSNLLIISFLDLGIKKKKKCGEQEGFYGKTFSEYI